MMWSFSFILLLLSAFPSCFVIGFKIDKSCEDKGIQNDIRDAMISAFTMANYAYALLTEDPVDPDTLELLGFLFAKEGVDPAQLLRDGKMAKTLEILRSITRNMYAEVVGDAIPQVEDVVRKKLFKYWVHGLC
jgi:hypothetical protein